MSNRCRRRRLPVFSDPSPVSFRPPKAASRAVCLKGDITTYEGEKDLRAGLEVGTKERQVKEVQKCAFQQNQGWVVLQDLLGHKMRARSTTSFLEAYSLPRIGILLTKHSRGDGGEISSAISIHDSPKDFFWGGFPS